MKTPRARHFFYWSLFGFLAAGGSLYLWDLKSKKDKQENNSPLPVQVATGGEVVPPVATPAWPSSKAFGKRLPGKEKAGDLDKRYPIVARDRYANAVTLAKSETPLANGKIARVRILKTSFKYPLLRIEETVIPANGHDDEISIQRSAMVADHVMVSVMQGVAQADFGKMLARHGAKVRKHVPRSDLYLVEFPAKELDAVPDAVKRFGGEKAFVKYAEPDYIAYGHL